MNEPEYEALQDVTRRLESAGIEFMLTGSFAMASYGLMRMTRDIDLVVALSAADVERVVELFEADYYIDSIAVARAIAHSSMFNIIYNKGVVKVDCIILKADAHQQEQFQRRSKKKLAEIEFDYIKQRAQAQGTSDLLAEVMKHNVRRPDAADTQ